MESIEEIEEFDELKSKVLKYVLYKKRTEAEIRQKFEQNTGNNLENVIEYLKEADYINDERYIKKAVEEYINLNNMSIKEIQYKLLSKGLDRALIDEYICKNKEKLVDFEFASAEKIYNKKKSIMADEEIFSFLRKKGYMEETIWSLK